MLGLVAWFSIAAQMTVYCAELNALLHHRLWPRGMVQPPLTKADQELAALQATTSQFRPEVEVHVTVKGRPMSQQEYLRTGQRPDLGEVGTVKQVPERVRTTRPTPRPDRGTTEGGAVTANAYSSPEKRSHADCLVIPNASPMRAQVAPSL